jgi:serine protease
MRFGGTSSRNNSPWTLVLALTILGSFAVTPAWSKLEPKSDADIGDGGAIGQFATAPVSDEELVQKSNKKKRYLVKNYGKKKKLHEDASLVSGNVVLELDGYEDIDSSVSVVEFDTDEEVHMFKGLGYADADIEEDPVRSLQRLRPPQQQLPAGIDPLEFRNKARRHLLAASQIIPYGLKRIFQEQLPDQSYYPTEITHPICILDSGFDASHPDLSAVELTSGDGKSTDACPSSWHGTHIAGTVVAEDNGVGVLGVFPGAPMMFVKVFGGNNCGWIYERNVYSSSLIEAARNCVDRGAKILSMSLGGGDRTNYEEKEFRRMSQELGVIFVAAAGNSAGTEYQYPASYSSFISVAATDEKNTKAGFSTYNDQVDVSAPGVDILSTVGEAAIFPITVGTAEAYPIVYMMSSRNIPDGTTLSGEACICTTLSCPATCSGKVCLISRGGTSFKNKGLFCEIAGGIAAVIYNYSGQGFIGGTLQDDSVGIPVFDTSGVLGYDMIQQDLTVSWGVQGGGGLKYDFYSGTSMATPHVSGAAYLLWNKYPECSNIEIRQALESSTLNLGNDNGVDNAYGHGLIQYWDAAAYLDTLGCSPQATDDTSASPSGVPSSPPSNTPSTTPSSTPSAAPSVSEKLSSLTISSVSAAPSATMSSPPTVASVTAAPSPTMSSSPTMSFQPPVIPSIAPVREPGSLYVAMIDYLIVDKTVYAELWLSETDVPGITVSIIVYKKNHIFDSLHLTTGENGKVSVALDRAKKNDEWLVQVLNMDIPGGAQFTYDSKRNMIDPGYTVRDDKGGKHVR